MIWTYPSKKHWLLACLFVALSFGSQAQHTISPKKMMELNQELKAMKKVMGDTLVKTQGNAMSLIYFWVSQQENQMESLINETDTLITKIEELSKRPPVNTSDISRVYLMLDSVRRIEKKFSPPAN